MKKTILLLFVLLITGCATKTFKPDLLQPAKKEQLMACFIEYCEGSENEKVKKAGLKIVEVVAASQNINLDLKRGSCERYFTQRRAVNGYRWLRRSTYQTCHEE